MLNNQSKQRLDRTNANIGEYNCPDPWEINTPPQQASEERQKSEVLTKSSTRIAMPEILSIPILPIHKATSTEILLEDELKLKAVTDSFLKPKLEKALALIYWLETINN